MKRDVNGILLLDKPSGITSNLALQKAKRLYHAKKAGHTGSLDPLASGLLPICFGEATKFSQYLLNADKRYIVTAQLGSNTDTGDADGRVIETFDSEITQEAITKVLPTFKGKQLQVPPMYSALKQQGQPLYKLARQGIEVERKPREIEIYEIKQLAFEENQLTLEVHCSKGTYIRSLVEDIATSLGSGAHVKVLRRTTIGDFTTEKMLTLPQLEASVDTLDAQLLPIYQPLLYLPSLTLSPSDLTLIKQGQGVTLPESQEPGLFRLLNEEGDFWGIVEAMPDGCLISKRLLKH